MGRKKGKSQGPKFSILRLYTDGASRGNPGPAGIGASIQDGSNRVVKEVRRFLGVATNNVAEYTALIEGLQAVREYDPVRLEVLSDSELVIKQMRGEYRVRNPNLIGLYHRAKDLAKCFKEIDFQAIPRESNRQADALANEAIDRGIHSVPKSIR